MILDYQKSKKNYIFPITIIGILFFIFGFVTWLNSTLIPFLKISCELASDFQAYMVTSAFYIAYFIMAIPSSFILKKTGFKNGMALGLIVMAIGSLIFIPAAYSRTFGLFLTGLFVQGTGLTLLQSAANPYATIIGPVESAAKRISIMGICNKVAGVLSPLTLGAILFQGANQILANLETLSGNEKELLLNSLAQRVIFPYIIMAIVLFGLAFMIRFVHLPEINESTSDNTFDKANIKPSVFHYPQLVLGVIALFFYVGVEVIAADTIIQFGQSQGFDLETAKIFASYTLIAMVVGYIIGIISIPKYIKQETALAISALLGVIFTVLALITEGYASIMCIAILGFANAIMWPAIWPLAINGLGKYTKIGSALLIMAIVGGASLPLVYGYLADLENVGRQFAYWIMAPLYVYIFFYAFKGHKYRTW